MHVKGAIRDLIVEISLDIPRPSTMADDEYLELPYTPIVAKDLGQDYELTEIACKHLEDTGTGSLRAEISSLKLQHASNLQAAYNLLDDTNNGKVIRNTLSHAKNLYKLENANDREQTAKSAQKLHAYLEPASDHASDRELAMTLAMAKVAVRVTRNRQQNYSDEFHILGREAPHFKAVICLQLEAMEDCRNRSHKGFFVRKLLSGLKKKQPEKRQEDDEEDDSDDQPLSKKRRLIPGNRNGAVLKTSNSGKQDEGVDLGTATDVDLDVAQLHRQGSQGSGAHSVSYPHQFAQQSSNRSDQRDKRQRPSSEAMQLLREQGVEPSASTTRFRAIRTRKPIITTTCITCEKEIPQGPSGSSRQCVACRRQAQEYPLGHQQVPASTAVMSTPSTAMAAPTAGRFAPTAVMVAPTPPPTQVSSIEHSATEKASNGISVRDFAPTYEQALQLKSTRVQSDKSKIETREQRIGNMSDFITDQEFEKQGLRTMLGEQRGESSRQKSELEGVQKKLIQLEARIQQLEKQI